MKRKLLSILVLNTIIFVPIMASEFVTIGTGGMGGTYYPTGKAVCKIVNKVKEHSGIRCSMEASGGSVYNINHIKSEDIELGISQSDTAYQAYYGKGKFKDKAYTSLRSVIAIYPELLAFVTKKGNGIKTIKDMVNKNINIDAPGSGTRITTEIVMDAFGIKKDSLSKVSEVKSDEASDMLHDGKIDGYFGVYGHPTSNIRNISSLVDIDIVPIVGDAVDMLVEKYPYYAKGKISGSFYKGVVLDVDSIGVKAVLITSTDLGEDSVYAIVKAILDNFEEFKSQHPAYKTITKESLLKGLSIPQHKGAIKAFKEDGLLK
jgi:TRAP transporter TAXI family solute receptor